MAGHIVTPYEVVATRKYVRDKDKRKEELLLASLGKEQTIELIEAEGWALGRLT